MVPWLAASEIPCGLRAGLLLAAMTLAAAARAQSAAPGATLAESLFQEGQALMDRGELAAACPKLAESQRLDPGGGTILNLAVCHDRQGRTATAWAEYQEALVQAMRDRRVDREELARTRIAALQQTVPKLIVRVAAAPAPAGMSIRVDGVELGPAAWGTELPVDPGDHTVSVDAPARRTWKVVVAIQASERREIAIPPLAPSEPAPAPGPTATQPHGPDLGADVDADPGATQRMIGYVTGSVGLLALGVGSMYGIQAVLDRRHSDTECENGCTDEGVRLNDDAKRHARIADVGVGLGVIGVGTAVYLLWTAPEPVSPQRRTSKLTAEPTATSVRLSPRFDGSNVAFAIDGRW